MDNLERVTGIEPVWVAWKATARPLGHTRLSSETGVKLKLRIAPRVTSGLKAVTLALSYSRLAGPGNWTELLLLYAMPFPALVTPLGASAATVVERPDGCERARVAGPISR